jgi:Arc/MetJ family transcription regulator
MTPLVYMNLYRTTPSAVALNDCGTNLNVQNAPTIPDWEITYIPRLVAYSDIVIFKAVLDERPYPVVDLTAEQWGDLAPRQIRLADLSTVRSTLDLNALLATDSTFFGDLFAHVVRWRGELYLENGLHRAVRAALQGRTSLHARILTLD